MCPSPSQRVSCSCYLATTSMFTHASSSSPCQWSPFPQVLSSSVHVSLIFPTLLPSHFRHFLMSCSKRSKIRCHLHRDTNTQTSFTRPRAQLVGCLLVPTRALEHQERPTSGTDAASVQPKSITGLCWVGQDQTEGGSCSPCVHCFAQCCASTTEDCQRMGRYKQKGLRPGKHRRLENVVSR